ncbi:MAG: DUF5074 domain-containing protein [Balneolaceae bacterium]
MNTYISSNRTVRLFTLLILFCVSFSACSDNPASDSEPFELVNVLVVNEGNWSDGNGEITSYNPESQQAFQNRFEQVNQRPLAGIIQSATFYENRLFLVTNNSDKLEIADAASLESIATLYFDGEDEIAMTPSSFIPVSETKGYMTGLYSNKAVVVDLENYTVGETEIPVGSNPRDAEVIGTHLFIANGGFGNDKTLTVINTVTDEAESTIEVGSGPIRLISDQIGRLWVVSNGYQAYDEDWNRDPENDLPGRVDVVDGATAQVIQTIETGGSPLSIALHEAAGVAWVVNTDAVQEIDMNSYEVTDTALIPRRFNGIGFSNVENLFYLADSRGYTDPGQAIFYNLEGAAVDSFPAGIAPREFLFQVELN